MTKRCWWLTRPASSRKGNKPVGVQRQYSGTAGRVENCQVGVFLAYAWARGRTLLDREPYRPQVWAGDRERRREAGVPEDVVFRTKPQLAQGMLERAVESGVPFGWVTGDEVYGNDRNLRLWLEHKGIPHVLDIRSNEKLWAWTGKVPHQVRADRLTSQVDETGWIRWSVGDGAKGPRFYGWATVDIRPLKEPGKGYWLLARLSIAKPGELAYYVCFGAVEPPRVTRRETRTLTWDEVHRLVEQVADPLFWTLFLLALQTGLRRAELVGLQWRDIELSTGILSVQRAWVKLPSRGTELTAPKSGRGRIVVLPVQSVEALGTHRDRQPPVGPGPGDQGVQENYEEGDDLGPAAPRSAAYPRLPDAG